MLTHAEFRSDAFPAYEGEEAEINPGRYGKRLGEFLKSGLEQAGRATGDLFAEDWGWVLLIENPELQLSLGIGNYEEYEDGFLVFIEPSKPKIRKFPKLWKAIDVRDTVVALQRQVDRILRESPEIRDLKWWSPAIAGLRVAYKRS